MRILKAVKIIHESHKRLIDIVKLRLPWLVLGLIGGTVGSFLVSRFEEILAANISLAFFVPLIVYMSDAVGSQTETVFVRDIAMPKIQFVKYLLKEILVGFWLGLILGVAIGIVASLWLGSVEVSLTVGVAMFVNVLIAPALALLISELLYKFRTDPALGAGPSTTVVQDLISLSIYFLVATLIIWHKPLLF